MITIDQFRESMSKDLPEIKDVPERDIQEFIELLELVSKIEADTLLESIQKEYAK